MSAGSAFFYGFLGGLLAEFISIRRFQYRALKDWPEGTKSWTFWIIAIVFCLFGGLVAFVYVKTNFKLNPLIAFNVGLTAPFLGENGLDKVLPKPDLGPTN